MKGISPVIATVLLLLMAVGAVGGSWVWYQRQTSIVGGEGEESINEQMANKMIASLSLADVYKDGTFLMLIVNNAGSSAVNVTGYKILDGTSLVVSTFNGDNLIGAQSSGLINTTVTCTTTNTLKIQLFAAGSSTQDYVEACP